MYNQIILLITPSLSLYIERKRSCTSSASNLCLFLPQKVNTPLCILLLVKYTELTVYVCETGIKRVVFYAFDCLNIRRTNTEYLGT